MTATAPPDDAGATPGSSDPPATAVPGPAPASPVSLRKRLAARMPEILIEALFMLVAVVLAFAIEEWREERELDGIAAQAREAILQEVARNREELLSSKPATLATLDALEARAAPGAAAASPDPAVNLQLSLLSTAAWRTAQSMEASRRMDYAWLLQISQTYELQAIYLDAQAATVEALVEYRTREDEAARRAAVRTLLGRVRVLESFGQSLEDDYDDILAGK